MGQATRGATATEAEAAILTDASKVISAAVAHSLARAGDSVSASGLRVLVMLDAAGSMNLSSVAERLGVNASTASRTCERLVIEGLIDRRDDATDRRHVALTLTTRGRRFVRNVMAERRAVLVRVLEAMPEDSRHDLIRGLEGFVAAAARLADNRQTVDGESAMLRWLI